MPASRGSGRRIRSPAGMWGKPTVVNNVKTWASVAPIITRGAAWYAAMGTKAHAGHDGLLAGRGGEERRAGGSALRHLAPRAGLRDRRRHRRRPAAEGPAGRRRLGAAAFRPRCSICAIDTEDRDGRDDHDRHRRDHRAGRQRPAWSTWPASWSDFFLDESCGKCVPCREGTKQMLAILTRICEGQGPPRRSGALGAAGQAPSIGGRLRAGRHGAQRRADHV